AALLSSYSLSDAERVPHAGDGMQGSLLGPSYSDDRIAAALDDVGARFERSHADEVVSRTARALADGKAIGWFQGRMEFWPRALGARSILADPRSTSMQSTLNQKIKFRESFRPFAPAVLQEHADSWFDLNVESPYMMLVAHVVEGKRRAMTPSERALFGIDK